MHRTNPLEIAENPARLCLLTFDECAELLTALDLEGELACKSGQRDRFPRIERAMDKVAEHGVAILEADDELPGTLH